MTEEAINRLTKQLIEDEGLRLRPYFDTVGKLTIGIGRNLDDIGISREESLYLCGNDILRAAKDLKANFPVFLTLDEKRQTVLLNMCFNMGWPRLSLFIKMLKAIEEGRFNDAADEMLDSKWATQVGKRAIRLANEMREDK